MEIIYEVPFRAGVVNELDSAADTLDFVRNEYKTYRIPCIYGIENQELSILVHELIINKAIDQRKDLKPYAKGLLSWLKWLKENSIEPFKVTFNKLKHPTYGYRNHLKTKVNNNEMASSTASSYINIVKSLYQMAGAAQVVDESQFFKRETSIVDGNRVVQSTNLSIRRVITKRKTLNPLNEIEQLAVNTVLKAESPDFQIMIRFMQSSGLRLDEVLTMTSSLFKEEILANSSSSLIRGLNIGPENGVHTKFDKDRELFITKTFYEDVLDYLISDEYETRLRKWRTKHGDHHPDEPLFITKYGDDFTSNAFYAKWYSFKKKVAATLNLDKFKHKPHDLRATFATNFLIAAMSYFPDLAAHCLGTVKYWMGHESETTTMKYITFIQKNKISDRVAGVMDKLVIEAMEIEESHD